MRFERALFRTAAVALASAFLCGTWVPLPLAAEEAAPDKSEAPKTLLAPKVEAKLKELMDKAKLEEAKAWDARVKKEIENIAKVTGLGEAGCKSLEAPAKETVNAALGPWTVKMGDMLRKQLALVPPEQAAAMLDQVLAQPAIIVQMEDEIGEPVLPFEQESWIKALHQTLTPGQAAAWDKAQADRKAEIEKEVGDVVKNGADRIRQQQTADILSKCGQIETSLGLSKDRSAKLEDLAKSVVDQTTEMWRKRVETMLLSMGDDQRRQIAQNGNIFVGPDESESPDQQTAWKEGVAHLLTADEATRLQTAQNTHKMKRAHVMGQVMLMLVDEKIALTEAQRQRLAPITDRLAKDAPELYPPEGDNNYFNTSPEAILAVAAKATDAELEAILDDVQLKRWHHFSDQDIDDLDDEDGVAPGPSGDGKSKPEENAEPEDVERLISLFFYEKTENERKRALEINILKAEDAVRAAKLDPEIAAQLQAAARGATEEYLTTWKWYMEQQIRANLQDVTPQNVKQRLLGFQNFFFQRNFGEPNGSDLWDETVKTELTAKQRESWQKETDARAAFHDKAVVELVMEEFDRENQIASDQWARLEPMIARVMKDYSAEIGQIFSQNNPPWYMQGPYMLLPFAGVSDADLKTVLSKDQMDRWHASGNCTNATNLWQNIEQIHKQRTQR